MLFEPDEETCYLYLIRHGATANNLADPPRIQGRHSDLGLVEDGRRQARAAANALRDAGLSAVYSSPLARARETAEIVAAPHQLGVHEVEALAEVDAGAWEGLSWKEIRANQPDAYQRFQDQPDRYGYLEGENLAEVSERVNAALQQIVERHRGASVAAVAHNVVNRVFLAGLLHMPLAKARSISQENCGINLVRFRTSKWKLVMFNGMLHLE